MYRCEACKRVAPPNRPANEVISEIRVKSYPTRARVHRTSGKRRNWKDDPGGRGWEAARTLRVCDECLPEAQAKFEELIANVASMTPVVMESQVVETNYGDDDDDDDDDDE